MVVALALITPASAAFLHPGTGVGEWIWTAKTYDRQECRFVRAFTIPKGASILSARLRITADNSYHVYLDDQPIGQGGDWRVLIEYDVRALLTPGEHVLAVSAVNDFDVAGLVVGLRVEMSNGEILEIASDNTWKIAPAEARSWTKKNSDWTQWPSAKVLPSFPAERNPQVYRAPITKPLEVALWQRGWFQATLSIVAVSSLAFGLFFASRLVIQSQMERVVRRERARIAEDLHDELGGGLTQLVLIGETSRREVPADSHAADTLGRLCDQTRGLLRSMNETVWLINSRRDTVRDFASYVAKYAESFFQNSTVRCRFDIEPDLPSLPCDIGIRRNMFLAVKEALNNVVRHAGATSAELKIARARQELVVTICDDGHGFDPLAENVGNGLANMRVRAREAGGSFVIWSTPGDGTTLEFRIPLQSVTPLRVKRFFGRKTRGTP